MKQLIFNTANDWTGLIVRLTFGLILWPHGAQKLFGWFGGYGFEGTMNFFTGTVHMPWVLGFFVVIIEFFGALAIIAGLASRIWGALMIMLFIGIIFTSHLDNGFFMNWFGNQKGEGYEFDLLMIGLSIAILVNGAGKFSIDGLISKASN